MRAPILMILPILSIVAAAQEGAVANLSANQWKPIQVVAAAATPESDMSSDSRFRMSLGAGVLTFYGDNIKNDPKASFELRGEYDVSERLYIYAAYVYGQAVVEKERYAIVPIFTPPIPGLGIFPLFLPPQVRSPTQGPQLSPRLLPIPFIWFRPGPVLPLPVKYDAGDEDKDIHIITVGPGLRYSPWERLSLNWDVGAGTVFGDDVDTHLALNTSLRAAWQMTDRTQLNLSLMGTLTNTQVGDADLDWGWGGHAGVSIALGSAKR